VSEFDEMEGAGGDVVPLEPLSRARGAGIHQASRALFDALYEANEPLRVEELAERSYSKVHPAVHYHARRAYVRELQRQRQAKKNERHGASADQSTLAPDVPLPHAWLQYVAHLTRGAVRHSTLVRDVDRYRLNPDKSPFLRLADGSRVRYTRDVWRELTAHERAVGEIQAMGMEANRVLTDLDRDTLRQAVALVARNLVENPVDERGLRGKLLWLMERPETDEGRAWLLSELVRRAYGQQPRQ